jgi:NTE family protein
MSDTNDTNDTTLSIAPIYTNIVFEGGGVLGVAYIGALRQLHSRKLLDKLRGFAGSSVGSIMATALACRASMDFIEKNLRGLNLRSFKDDSYNPLIDGINLIRHYGFCRGDKLYSWLGDLLEELSGDRDITFREVYTMFDSILVVPATSLNTLSTVYFSHIGHPDMPVRMAIRMSASIPYFFRAVHFSNDVFVDAGILNNFPLNIFDDNAYLTASPLLALAPPQASALASASAPLLPVGGNTLGLKLITSNEARGHIPPVVGIKSFTVNIFEAMSVAIANSHVRECDWARSIKINTGAISSIDFDLSDEDAEWLIKQGDEAVVAFLGVVALAVAPLPVVSAVAPSPAVALVVAPTVAPTVSSPINIKPAISTSQPTSPQTHPEFKSSPPVDIPKKRK